MVKGCGGIKFLGFISNRANGLSGNAVLGVIAEQVYVVNKIVPFFFHFLHNSHCGDHIVYRPMGVDHLIGKVVNLNANTQLQVVLVKPERYDNVSDIADHLRQKRAVLLNLEATNKDVARRLVDFLSGCAYALDGKIKKVAISTYIITPYHVDIVGDLVEELENNGMYF